MILVDGDILVYRCGFAAEKTKHYVNGELRENKKDAMAYIEFLEEEFGEKGEYTSEVELEPVENCLQMVRSSLDNIREALDYFGDMRVFLTGEGNFREEVATIKEYKGNRKEARKPHWYDEIRDYLIRRWGAEVVDGQEADDAIGIAAWNSYKECPEYSIIASIDKDLRMIPGYHYNWVKGESDYISDLDAMKNFYMQVLTGDATDNIPGIPGIGPVKAARMLDDHTYEGEMYTTVLGAYDEYILSLPDVPEGLNEYDSDVDIYEEYLERAEERMTEVATLLWIRREENEMWKPFKYPT